MQAIFMYQSEEKNWTISDLDYEAKENLVGFFELLLIIDRRNNPELYARHRDSNNS